LWPRRQQQKLLGHHDQLDPKGRLPCPLVRDHGIDFGTLHRGLNMIGVESGRHSSIRRATPSMSIIASAASS
jgi:hypothetical protein